MALVTVWTKQHENVLRILEDTGRYVAKREYIEKDVEEHAHLVLFSYDWLAKHLPNAAQKPEDTEYPVWLSLKHEATMLPSPGTVILELTFDDSIMALVNIMKWGYILDYSYIPANEADSRRHRELLQDYRTNDAKAVMTPFYPEIKREIVDSWDRLFDDSVDFGNSDCYGLIWEIRKEWITDIIR